MNSIVLVFDVADRKSFESIDKWHADYFEHGIKASKVSSKCQVIICGNKSDLKDKRQVKEEEGKELAKSWNALYFETFAQSNELVDAMFLAVAQTL